jgi:hypothetical protein
MQTQRKWQVLSIMMIVVIAAMSFAAVAAQDDDAAAPFDRPCGMTGDFGPGAMGNFGGMMGYDNDMHDLTAELLGLDAEALWDAMQDGKSIADLAEEQGVELQVIIEAHMVAGAERMAEMVEAGVMTQEQSSEMLTYMAANIADHFSGDYSSGFGPGMMWDGTEGHPMFDGEWPEGHPMADGEWTGEHPMWDNDGDTDYRRGGHHGMTGRGSW